MNKEYILSNLPDGYVYLAEGEDMPEISHYVFTYKEVAENKLKDIKNWNKYERTAIGEKRNKDIMSIFIKAAPAPAPVVPPAPKYQYKQITDINIGDIFAYKDTGEAVIITHSSVLHDKFTIIGLNNTLNHFSFNPLNKEKMIAYLNSNMYIYITSIAPQIEKTLKLARKLVLDNNK